MDVYVYMYVDRLLRKMSLLELSCPGPFTASYSISLALNQPFFEEQATETVPPKNPSVQ